MPTFIDQLGRRLELAKPPERIVSVVPSQTELLYDLGLDDRVVGITKFCVRPEEWFRSKTRVGGTKQLKLDIIPDLKPDLILANKEENVAEQIAELALQFPVWVSDVKDLEDALQMIKPVGDMTNTRVRAQEIIHAIRDGLSTMKTLATPTRAAYFIWNDPMMVAGGDTFIHNMMTYFGVDNVFGGAERYPEVTPAQLQEANPDVILLSSEPFPFAEKHTAAFAEVCPRARVLLVDGQMFSWYGSRLLHVPGYFNELRARLLSSRPHAHA